MVWDGMPAARRASLVCPYMISTPPSDAVKAKSPTSSHTWTKRSFGLYFSNIPSTKRFGVFARRETLHILHCWGAAVRCRAPACGVSPQGEPDRRSSLNMRPAWFQCVRAMMFHRDLKGAGVRHSPA